MKKKLLRTVCAALAVTFGSVGCTGNEAGTMKEGPMNTAPPDYTTTEAILKAHGMYTTHWKRLQRRREISSQYLQVQGLLIPHRAIHILSKKGIQ